MVPLVIALVLMVPLVKTVGSQYCRQPTVWAKLPTLESNIHIENEKYKNILDGLIIILLLTSRV